MVVSPFKYYKQQIQIRRIANFIILVYSAILTGLLSLEVQLVRSNRKSSPYRVTLEKHRLPKQESLHFILSGQESQILQHHSK